MKKIFQIRAVRYLIAGGCTTVVNLVSYYLLCRAGVNITVANTIAIMAAILFAYIVNKLFVFAHKTSSAWELVKEAGKFIGMRMGTMLIELTGVLCLTCILSVPNMISKLLIQVVIFVLNYLISRFIVFTDQDKTDQSPDQLLRKKRSREYFLAGFGLSGAVALAGFITVSVWPFGDKILLIIDSLHQYLPFYTDFHDKLVNSESFLYSFSAGLGYNFWSTYAYYMASPLNLLMAFIPRENVCDFMDLMILVKIALSGGCFSWYLHKRDEERRYLPVVFGLMFALSNFMIGYYFNLMWLDSIAMLPLIMYGIEQIVRGKSGRFFCLSLFYGLWCNYYIGFMLCLFACLYFLVCWISQTGSYGKMDAPACPDPVPASTRRPLHFLGRDIGKSCLTFAWYALLAGGMAAIVLLPAYIGLTASEAMGSNSFPTTVKFYQNLAELLENHMAFMEPVTISDSQVGLNVYCGMATVLLAVLYLFDGKIRLRERLSYYGLIALLLFSFACNIPNYIWHGFHQQNGLPNRFAFLYIALLLVMAYDVLGHLKSLRLPAILLSAAIPVAFLTVRVLNPDREWETYLYLISAGLLILYLGIFLIGKYLVRRRIQVFYAVLTAVMVVEVGANAIYGIYCNGSVTRSIYLADQTSYQALIDGLEEEDDSFYRSEVDRTRMRNVTMFVGGNAMVMFNSTMQASVTDFCDALGIEARTNKNGYLGVTNLMNDVLGIKYVASPTDSETLYQMIPLDRDGELTLYLNENALSLGFMVSDDILDWDTEGGEPLEVQNEFVELATDQDPIFVLDRTIDMEDGETYAVKVPENKQVYLCVDTRVKEIELNTPEYDKTYSDYTDHLYPINGTSESDLADFTVTLKDSQSSVPAEVYTCSNAAYQAVVDQLAESQLEDVKAEGNTLSGTIDVKEAGTMLLTIPYDEGWKILVDGEETEASCVGGALIGIHLDEGVHTINMRYTPLGLIPGCVITLAAMLLFLVTMIFERRRKAMPEQLQMLREAAQDPTCVCEQEEMKEHTTFRIGGPADYFAAPATQEGICGVVRVCREQGWPFYVVGNGSNLLVSDAGYHGVILQLYRNFSDVTVDGTKIRAQAGAMLSVIAKRAREAHLTGFEFASGIPGTLGGAVVMNAGAYGGEMKDVLVSATVLTPENEVVKVQAKDLKLGYRQSAVLPNGWIVLGAEISLTHGDPDEIQARMDELKEKRVEKQPLDLPSAGSTFKRPEGYFAGKLIMDAGLSGYRVGGAQVSEKHCGFVVNAGGATAQDVYVLTEEVKKKVKEHAGVTLEREIRLLGRFD